jgi:hypothetical protein
VNEAVLKEVYQMRHGEYRKWLEQSANDVAAKLVFASDEATIRQLQGRAQQLLDLIEMIDNAGQQLDKLRKPKTDMQKAY